MLFYILIGIIYVMLTWLLVWTKRLKDTNKDNKKYKIIYILSFIGTLLPLGLVAGLRYNVGTDYFHTYVPHFKDIFADEYHYSEKPFVWLNMLLRLLTDNPVWLFLLMGFIFITFIQLSIVKISDNWIISSIFVIVSNMFFVSLNQTRQMVAVSIMMYAFTFVFDKKIWHFLGFVLLASCFHLSSFIILPFYFIVNNKWIKKYSFFILLGVIALIPATQFLIKWLVGLTKYSYYLTDPQYNTEQFITAYFFMALVIEVSVIICYRLFNDELKQKAYAFLVLNSISLFIGFMGFFITVPELMARTYLLFSWSSLFLAPILFKGIDNKIIKYSVISLVSAVFLAGTLYIILVQKHHEIIPYLWIFSK